MAIQKFHEEAFLDIWIAAIFSVASALRNLSSPMGNSWILLNYLIRNSRNTNTHTHQCNLANYHISNPRTSVALPHSWMNRGWKEWKMEMDLISRCTPSKKECCAQTTARPERAKRLFADFRSLDIWLGIQTRSTQRAEPRGWALEWRDRVLG